MSKDESVQRFLDHGQELGWWRRGKAYSYYCRRMLFRDVELSGKRLLDVGCGNGRFCIWAALHGASEAVGLEPLTEGSRGNRPVLEFRSLIERFGLPQVTVLEQTLQEYRPADGAFDVIVMHASINHVEEEACITLLDDAESWSRYEQVARQLRSLLVPGGYLILVDCGRRNLWGDLGLRNPLAPSIEWHKHQQPGTWSRLFGACGFTTAATTWLSLSAFMQAGVLLRNFPCGYVTNSMFRLLLRAQ